MPAIGQNDTQNNTLKPAEDTNENLERARIKRERDQLNLNLAEQRRACYQKLAVTPCLNDARDVHNEKMRDLKRQEVALNNAQRKRAAADRVEALDQRNSPEAQLRRAQERGKAMEAAARREESQAQRQKSREAKLAEAAANAQAKSNAPAKEREAELPQPQGKPSGQAAKKVAPDQGLGQAERAAKSSQQAAQREKEAAERRAKAAEREAKRKKPAAAGLPVPP
ncbi:hypothetical protein [Variovorax sp. PCZ-1]|uniref:hypothetical protein n=1 Tax=Variovorax sp. PCZ-1 TaxID=2835533 RepID=UPI001BD063AC|nr:hypothetical protein [Variovorax sp. PCZ-1]MBS7808447.1 hypothetical protein [Variovorax sp. PCZ-1]